MAKTPRFYITIVLAVLVVALTGCELSRDEGAVSDPGPVSDLPPTLAPLSAETEMVQAAPGSGDVAIESTTITAVTADQQTGDVTVDVVDTAATEVTVEGMNSDQVAEASTTDTNQGDVPVAEAAVDESIVVDASESLPLGGPVAAEPPASATDGGYGNTPSYGQLAYQVRPGDTLFSIAQRYGTSVDAIVYANGLTSEIIQIGQVLNVPASANAPVGNPGMEQPTYQDPAYEQQPYNQQPYNQPQLYTPGPGDTFHLVSPGETLYQVALRYGSTVEAIAYANRMSEPYILQIGQQLIVPAVGNQPGANPYGQQQPYGYDQQQQPYGYDQQQQPYGYDQQQPLWLRPAALWLRPTATISNSPMVTINSNSPTVTTSSNSPMVTINSNSPTVTTSSNPTATISNSPMVTTSSNSPMATISSNSIPRAATTTLVREMAQHIRLPPARQSTPSLCGTARLRRQ
jgi:LysM repeat protein